MWVFTFVSVWKTCARDLFSQTHQERARGHKVTGSKCHRSLNLRLDVPGEQRLFMNPLFVWPHSVLCENNMLSWPLLTIWHLLNPLHDFYCMVFFLSLSSLCLFFDRKVWTVLLLTGLRSWLFQAFSARPIKICHITMVTFLFSLHLTYVKIWYFWSLLPFAYTPRWMTQFKWDSLVW